MKKFKISIIIPVTKMSGRLQNLNLTVKHSANKEIELIVVHDNQDDLTGNELLEIIKGFNHVKFLQGSYGSASLARNAGLKKASSDWIGFWDSDDLPNIENYLKLLDKIKAEKNLIGVGGFNVVPKLQKNSSIKYLLNENSPSNFFKNITNNPGLWRWIFSKKIVKNAKFPDIKVGEDICYICEALITTNGLTIYNESVYDYYVGDPDQTTTLLDGNYKIISIVDYLQKVVQKKGHNKRIVQSIFLRQIFSSLKHDNVRARIRTFGIFLTVYTKFSSEDKFYAIKYIFKNVLFDKSISIPTFNDGLMHFPIVYVHAGLGNQLFQIAAAKSFFKNSSFFLDLNSNSNIYQPISNLQFRVKLNLIPSKKKSFIEQKLINLIIRSQYRPNRNKYTQIIYFIVDYFAKIMLSKVFLKGRKVVTSSEIGFDAKLKSIKPYSYVIGYFQSYKWSSNIQTRQFMKSINLVHYNYFLVYYERLAKYEKPLIIHIRLGDYANLDLFGIPEKEYYFKALRMAWASNKYKKIWVFSNEPGKVEQFIPSELKKFCRIVTQELENAAATFQIMRLGKGYVLSNSTFGWWAAFLSESENAKVFVPSPWFKNIAEPKYIIPPSWKKLESWPAKITNNI